MACDNVEATLNIALEKAGPKKYAFALSQIEHFRNASYQPITQGKSERRNRLMKHIVKLQNYYLPSELEKSIGEFVEYYNQRRNHETIDKLILTNVFHDRSEEVLSKKELIKVLTFEKHRRTNLQFHLLGCIIQYKFVLKLERLP